MALSTLKLLQYNNYFNRQVKIPETYPDAVATFTNVNFVPNDGVNTEITLNNSVSADYLLVYEDDTLISRWFIIEAERTKIGQYRYVLHRDVIADNFSAVVNAPCFIEKGMVRPDNPLIFNKEGQGYNQIKQSETLLQDQGKCPWIVLYLTKTAGQQEVSVSSKIPDNVISLDVANLEAWDYYQYTQGTEFIGNMYDVTQYISCSISGFLFFDNLVNLVWKDNSLYYGIYSDLTNISLELNQDWSLSSLQSVIKSLGSNTENLLRTIVGASTEDTTNDLLSYNGKYIRFTDGNTYLITIAPTTTAEYDSEVVDDSTSLFSTWQSIIDASGQFRTDHTTLEEGNLMYSCKMQKYIVTATLQTAMSETITIPASRTFTDDALYNIIALPYADKDVWVSATRYITISKDHQLDLANQIATAYTSTYCTDIQLLPYCPIQEILDSTGDIYLDKLTSGTDFVYGTDTVVLFAPNANFTFDIPVSIPIERSYYSNTYEVTENSMTKYAIYVLDTDKWYDITYSIGLNSNYGSQDNYSWVIYNQDGSIYKSGSCYNISIQSGSTADTRRLVFTKYVDGTATTETVYGSELIEPERTFNVSLITDYGSYYQFTYFKQIFYRLDEGYEWPLAYDIKVDNECNLYRLVSPNYQGQFEFSAAKNSGVERFNVDCTYKPINPYIHVNPNFRNLYGQDFNDSRGLICNGDFSIGQLDSAWSTYEYQNKNYEAIFNRQIQNMDVNNRITNSETIASTIVSSVTAGATAGIAAGAMTGNPVVGVAAGATAGVASAAGGAIDYHNQLKRQEEARDFSIDMYNYNLQNIQALPYTLTKNSALTYNNKIYPFVEKYSATETEKNALRNKITYEGMTVMAIDRISTYSGGFVKGRLIRLSDITDDSQMAYAIYEEVNKGLYLEV